MSEKAENIKISIIVPIYKVEKELARCVKSIINQTYSNIEVILVDDGSPDLCPMLCDEYASADSRINVIHKINGGLSDARNAGLMQATGDYILFVDSDDYIELDSCERFVSALQNCTPDIVVAEAQQFNGNNVDYYCHSNLDEHKIYSSKDYLENAIPKSECYAPVWLNLYRKDFLITKELFFVKGLLHEDMEMLPRLFLSAQTIVYLKYVFYNYIIRENSIMQSRSYKKNAMDLMKIYSDWKYTFDHISDINLQKALYGFLSKCYLHTCREFKIVNKGIIDGINSKFLIKSSLNAKEKIKEIFYAISPNLYVNIK